MEFELALHLTLGVGSLLNLITLGKEFNGTVQAVDEQSRVEGFIAGSLLDFLLEQTALDFSCQVISIVQFLGLRVRQGGNNGLLGLYEFLFIKLFLGFVNCHVLAVSKRRSQYCYCR